MSKDRKSASGSKKRQLGVVVTYRTTPDRVAALRAVAADRGLTLAAYLRNREEGSPGARPVRRRFLPEEQTMRDMMTELNRHGVNLNQIARAVNIDGDTYGLEPLIDRLDALYAACCETIGKAPS